MIWGPLKRTAKLLAGAMTSKLRSKQLGSGGIRTHASEETGALNQRLRPLGHATPIAVLTWKSASTEGHST